MQKKLSEVVVWLRSNWRRASIFGGAGLLALVILVQIFYPGDRLLPFANIDGVGVGGWHKTDAAKLLDQKYSTQLLNVYFGDAKKPYATPKLADIGVTSSNGNRLNNVKYAWWLRIMPLSILWGQIPVNEGQPAISYNSAKSDEYINKMVGESCIINPKNASLTASDGKLKVVPSEVGGKCELSKVKSAIAGIKPNIKSENKIRVAAQKLSPEIDDAAAKALADKLQSRVGDGVALKVANETVVLPTAEVLNWLDFVVVSGVLTPQMNAARATDYLSETIAPKLAIKAGVSKITTHDFVETFRQDGANGQALNQATTLNAVLAYLTSQTNEVVAQAMPVLPTVEYTRTYSPTNQGIMALVEHYAKDNKGTFGISFVELSGERRRASYNDTRQFTTASVYKLFVAYSTLRRVEAGTFNWSDQISGGRDLATCFDDMIVKSDNACGEALLAKIGYRAATDEMKALGLNNTTFLKGNMPLTTSGDLAIFLATLESGQMLSPDSRSRLLDAMKRNIFRQGVPAGTSSQVANKVGFMDGLLHDAAIVYNPSGTYILTVLSEGSTWSAIADLTREIEKLRA